MKCEQDTYLQELAVDYLQTSSLGTSQSLLSNGIHTLAVSCASEQQKDGSQDCESTKETYGCLTHPNTPEAWIASMQDSLAKICRELGSRPDLEKALEAGFTEKSCESLAWLDRDTYSWKTYQQSFLTGWEPYSETWPRWGMTQGGAAFAHPMSKVCITETGGGYWPTPRAQMGKHGICWSRAESGDHRSQLEDYLAHLYVKAGGKRISRMLIHPSFCERLMRWPMGYTVCTQSATGKTRCKPPSHGNCLVESEA